MSGTVRAVAVPGERVHVASESRRIRVEREARIARADRDAKRIERSERWTERRELRRPIDLFERFAAQAEFG